MARYGPKPRPVEERFWDHVSRASPAECWEWQGAIEGSGYGYMTLTRTPRRWVRAHRLSYEMHHGPIPDGLAVCHRCDNRLCVNPAHLFAGTWGDNNADRAARGRGRENRQHGRANLNAKLTEANVREIISAVASGESQGSVSRRIGISQAQVSKIVHGKSWAHLWDE